MIEMEVSLPNVMRGNMDCANVTLVYDDGNIVFTELG